MFLKWYTVSLLTSIEYCSSFLLKVRKWVLFNEALYYFIYIYFTEAIIDVLVRDPTHLSEAHLHNPVT